MAVKAVSDPHEYQSILTASGERLVVVDFTAKWCGPCKTIAPVYESLATKYSHVTFLKVDVDQSQQIAAAEGVSAMPTFHFYKNNKKLGDLKGASPSALENMIKQHAGTPAGSAGSGTGSAVPGQFDVTDQVALNQLSCLNEQAEHNIRSIFPPKNNEYLESDVDEQLMICIQFNQNVKIHSLKISAPMDQAPKTIKLYANILSLGFDEAEEVQETQTLEITEKDYDDGGIIPLRFVKFQNVNSLILFVVDNLTDADTTRINRLEFVGSVIEGSDRTKQIAKVEDNH